MKKSKPFRDIELELLKDPAKAREYLRISLDETRKDGNRAAFLRALRMVVDARGGIVELAKLTEKPTSSLYKAVSEQGNPRLDTLDLILRDIGLQLTVDLVEQQR
ncbi:transcriptional regulator [bacterium]|nr:transcriptional regulator [bacterium]